MKWLRLYYEARTDAKLRTLTDAEHRVWFNLLCLSCEAEPRGEVNGKSVAVLAAEVARGRVGLLERTLTKLTELEILEEATGAKGGRALVFRHFDKRQYVDGRKPSDAPEQTAARQRKSRTKRTEAVTHV